MFQTDPDLPPNLEFGHIVHNSQISGEILTRKQQQFGVWVEQEQDISNLLVGYVSSPLIQYRSIHPLSSNS